MKLAELMKKQADKVVYGKMDASELIESLGLSGYDELLIKIKSTIEDESKQGKYSYITHLSGDLIDYLDDVHEDLVAEGFDVKVEYMDTKLAYENESNDFIKHNVAFGYCVIISWI